MNKFRYEEKTPDEYNNCVKLPDLMCLMAETCVGWQVKLICCGIRQKKKKNKKQITINAVREYIMAVKM